MGCRGIEGTKTCLSTGVNWIEGVEVELRYLKRLRIKMCLRRVERD